MGLAVIEVIEKYGLHDDVRISQFMRKARRKEIRTLFEELSTSLKESDTKPIPAALSPFNFFASGSLRGDLYCWEASCRLRRLKHLERFASLYSDRIVVPFYLNFYPGESGFNDRVKATLQIIAELRPAFDAGIFIPVAEELCMCPKCTAKAAGFGGLFDEVVKDFVERYADRLEVTFAGRHGAARKGSYRISGPDTIFCSETVIRSSDHVDKLLENSQLRSGQRLSRSQVVESEILQIFFEEIIRDCSIQRHYAESYGYSYLSNNHREAEVLEALHAQGTGRVSQTTFDVMSRLVHEIPMFSEIPLSVLRQLRNDEPDAFDSYRSSIDTALKEYREGNLPSGNVADELFRDVILPKVNQLRAAEANAKRLRNFNFMQGLVIPAISVAFGMLGSLPHDLANALNLFGGVSALNAVSEPFRERNKRQADIRNDSMFYLLEVDKKFRKYIDCAHS